MSYYNTIVILNHRLMPVFSHCNPCEFRETQVTLSTDVTKLEQIGRNGIDKKSCHCILGWIRTLNLISSWKGHILCKQSPERAPPPAYLGRDKGQGCPAISHSLLSASDSGAPGYVLYLLQPAIMFVGFIGGGAKMSSAG